LLDGWPQFSDAVVDYYFAKKLAYHYLWRVQRPVAVFVGDMGAEKHLYIANDTRQDAEVTYRVWDADTDATLAEGHTTSIANQNHPITSLSLAQANPQLILIEWQIGQQLFGNHYLAHTPPVDFTRYLSWLPKIANLQRIFFVRK
jgi:beta-mannosidase